MKLLIVSVFYHKTPSNIKACPAHRFWNERVTQRAAHLREDDKVVPYRLGEFERITKPVIERLREQGRIHEIGGLGGREAVGTRAAELFMPVQNEYEPTLPMMARG